MVKNSNTGRKAWKRILSGLGFFASILVTAVLMVYFGQETEGLVPIIIAGVVMLVAAFFFLSSVFEDKTSALGRLEEEEERREKEEAAQKRVEFEFRKELKEYMESLDRTQKAVFSVMKRNEENTEEQIRRLERAISKLSDQQTSDHKALVKYNKENARQMAINERETLEHVLDEIVKNLQEGTTKEIEVLQSLFEKGVPMAQVNDSYTENQSYEEPYEEPYEESNTEKFFGDIFNNEVAEEENTELPDDLLGAIEENAELPDDLLGAIEENAELPDDLLAAMSTETETPVQEPENEVTTDLLGAANVDLSDPNATLSPENIARLFAAAGN